MDILELVRTWLQRQGIDAAVDRCGPKPGSAGLFPQGRQQLVLREDVLGNRVCRVRYTFTLRLTEIPGGSTANTLLRLQELAATDPPVESFRAENGRLVKNTGTGLSCYEIRLTAEREELL